MSTSKKYTIELDCAPGWPRPGDLLPDVLAGTGITLDAEKPQSMFFGNWVWEIPQDQVLKYEIARPTIISRIQALYGAGRIRYGSW